MTAMVEKALWYRNRLAAMSVPELVFRAQENLRRRVDKKAAQRLVPFTGNGTPIFPKLREGLLQADIPKPLLAEWGETLRQAVSGKFHLLGQIWPECNRDTRWHLDPVSREFWPESGYCFDIGYRHAPDMGDVKYVWELNRLQYLQPIAALAFISKDREASLFCVAEIESWIDNNPPHLGVNWASGIELAFRAISLLIVTTLVGDSMTPVQHRKIMTTLERHGLWLARYPSRYSSANNHRTAEGLGLLAIGALCPGFDNAGAWKTLGWDILCEDSHQQILPDGVGAEQTITYTAVVLEMLLLGRHIAQATGLAIPTHYDQHLVLGGEYLRWFTDAGGAQPRIGDDDNACVLGVYRQGEPYVSSVLGCIAALADRPDLSPPRAEPHLRHFVLGTAPPPGQPPSGVRHFPHGGYTVGRSVVRGRDMLLAFDHGYLGYLSIAAHGHADALSLWLHIDDQPVLVDAGTYLYHSGGEWRGRFRGTAAHNTLCLEHRNSSIMSGNFNWSHKANARLVAHGSEAGSWWVEAEHDGYKRGFATTHRRRLTVAEDDVVTVEDWLLADSPHHVDINFLLHPALTIALQNGVCHIRKNGVDILNLRGQGPLMTHITPATDDDPGWYSPGFGQKQPAARLSFSGVLAPRQIMATRFSLA